MRLKGKRVLITGAGGAIGSGLALGFAREGADVAIHYRASGQNAEDNAAKCRALGVRAVTIQADVSKTDEIERMIREAVEGLGGIDILINNAIYGPQIDIMELSLEEINRTFDTNLRGYYYTGLLGARQMVRQGNRRGWIVNISSISSRCMTSTYTHYGATKGGVEATTRGFAVAFAKYGINVNCVAPGCVATPTVKNMFEDPVNADPVLSRTPTGFIPEIEDVVGPVIFLCTEEARAITGQTIDVDGGYVIQGMEWNLSEEMKDFRNKLEEGGADQLRK
ncbi:MAG: SDR family oxidoreductase [Clostridiales bacterium]|nr:SDR family oxidoreductase [Clostridiales bacterium]